MRIHALRLDPGDDLKDGLSAAVRGHGLKAGFVLTAVGSLSRARLRMPGEAAEERVLAWTEPMEIISLSGTLSPDGLHLHLCLSRRDGACVGGHLMAGCLVRTTAELVIGEAPGLLFRRPLDPRTGYGELEVVQLADGVGELVRIGSDEAGEAVDDRHPARGGEGQTGQDTPADPPHVALAPPFTR